jgi:FADH2 O2-dependent halogenase
MIQYDTDIAVIGSGFAGSLAAILLARQGRSVVLIDRTGHPRFAIGESSTPNADLMLLTLAEQYDLPWLAPLAKYGTWQATYPHLVCGLKRGFSYFHQPAGRPFRSDPEHQNELLVAASPDDERSDTHWLRADVDGFIAAQAAKAGVPLLDHTTIALAPGPAGWRLTGHRREEAVQIDARFIIDGTGEFGIVPRTLGIASQTHQLATNSRTVFAHFRGMRPWHEVLAAQPHATDDHPFCCDHAALHHVLDEGWMYQLPFNNGVTSAGVVLDASESPLDESLPIAEEWRRLMARYPSVAEQFAEAEIVSPPGGMGRTGRLQRKISRVAGENWALLPHTAGFIDPLHSTGIAQSLCGVARLAAILNEHWGRPTLPAELARYERSLQHELTLIDRLVSSCYRARRHFPLFAACAMLYFAGAHTSETRRLAGEVAPGEGFLCASDPQFQAIVAEAWKRVSLLTGGRFPTHAEVDAFARETAESLRPYNLAGLFDPAAHNMYRFTAINKVSTNK